MSDRVDRMALQWFGYLNRMSGQRLTQRLYETEGEGKRDRDRLCTRWQGGVKKHA